MIDGRHDSEEDCATARQAVAIKHASKIGDRLCESSSLVSFITTANEHLDQREIGELLHALHSGEAAERDMAIPPDISVLLAHDPILSDARSTTEMFRVAVHQVLHCHLDAETLARNNAAAMSRAAKKRGYIRKSLREGDWTDVELIRLLEAVQESGVRRGSKFNLKALSDRMGMEPEPVVMERINGRLKKWRRRIEKVMSPKRMNPHLEAVESVQLLHVLGSVHSRNESGEPDWNFMIEEIRKRTGANGELTAKRCRVDVSHKKKILGVR